MATQPSIEPFPRTGSSLFVSSSVYVIIVINMGIITIFNKTIAIVITSKERQIWNGCESSFPYFC